jgi:hypothetical protein
MQVPQELKIELIDDLTIPFLGIYLKKYFSTPMLIATLFTTGKLWNQPRCTTFNEQIKKM